MQGYIKLHCVYNYNSATVYLCVWVFHTASSDFCFLTREPITSFVNALRLIINIGWRNFDLFYLNYVYSILSTFKH